MHVAHGWVRPQQLPGDPQRGVRGDRQGPEKINAWAKKRGWSQIALLSGFESPFQADYKCQGESDEMQWPVMHVFTKKGGKIHHFWATELPGNHVDTVWPYWNLMDFTPEGRPDIPVPPQKFRSKFLEEHYLNKE